MSVSSGHGPLSFGASRPDALGSWLQWRAWKKEAGESVLPQILVRRRRDGLEKIDACAGRKEQEASGSSTLQRMALLLLCILVGRWGAEVAGVLFLCLMSAARSHAVLADGELGNAGGRLDFPS